MRFPILKLAEPLDPLPDDRQAVLPKLLLAYVDPEALRQVRRIRLARRCQQELVILHERRAPLLVDRIQSRREQQPERIREVIEGKPGRIIVRLPRPHELLQVSLVQTVAVRVLLRPFHDLVQVVRR